MYRHPDKDIAYIGHPKTASQAARVALTERKWARSSGHHDIDKPLPKNVISVIRAPADWYVSWWFHTHRDVTFEEWIFKFITENPHSKKGFFGVPYTTHLIFYDNLHNGWDAVCDDLGIDRFELPRVNVKKRKGATVEEFITDDMRAAMRVDMVQQYDTLRETFDNEGLLGAPPFLRLDYA